MKKIVISIISIMLVFGLTGCGTEKINKAKIKDNENNNVELTSADLVATHNDNETKFEKLYYKAEIDITEEYESVTKQGNVTCLNLKNNWVIAYHKSQGSFIDIVAELQKGDKVHFTGTIYDLGGYCGSSNGETIELSVRDNSTIEIIK